MMKLAADSLSMKSKSQTQGSTSFTALQTAEIRPCESWFASTSNAARIVLPVPLEP